MKLTTLCATAALLGAAAYAGPVQITSAAALGANDSIVWGQFGPVGTVLSPQQAFTTTAGLTGTVFDQVAPKLQDASAVNLTTSPVYDDQFPPTEGVNISFDSQVEGVGVLVMNEFGSTQNFNYEMLVYSGNTVIAQYVVGSPQVANTPSYLGVLDTTADITAIYITATGFSGNTGQYFALDTVNVLDDAGVQPSQTPEPASLLLAAPAILILWTRKRKLIAAAECWAGHAGVASLAHRRTRT